MLSSVGVVSLEASVGCECRMLRELNGLCESFVRVRANHCLNHGDREYIVFLFDIVLCRSWYLCVRLAVESALFMIGHSVYG